MPVDTFGDRGAGVPDQPREEVSCSGTPGSDVTETKEWRSSSVGQLAGDLTLIRRCVLCLRVAALVAETVPATSF